MANIDAVRWIEVTDRSTPVGYREFLDPVSGSRCVIRAHTVDEDGRPTGAAHANDPAGGVGPGLDQASGANGARFFVYSVVATGLALAGIAITVWQALKMFGGDS